MEKAGEGNRKQINHYTAHTFILDGHWSIEDLSKIHWLENMFVAFILALLERQLMRCWRCASCIYDSAQKDKLQTKEDTDPVWSMKPLMCVIKY